MRKQKDKGMAYRDPVPRVETNRKCPACGSVLVLETHTIRKGKTRSFNMKTRGTVKIPVYGPGEVSGHSYVLVCANDACDHRRKINENERNQIVFGDA